MQQAECSHMRGSVERWVQLDGHALLFIFLPPLLFADTMHMDWALFKVSLGQCMLLASTGVLLGALLTALYAMALPYGWDFGLALGFGAVQAATDPVAVVSLLASLGALLACCRLKQSHFAERSSSGEASATTSSLTISSDHHGTPKPSQPKRQFRRQAVLRRVSGNVKPSSRR